MRRTATPKIVLRVLEADPRDVGRGIARVDPDAMGKLGLENGDVVFVEGRRKTVVRVAQSRIQDRGLGIIRLDATIRQNAGVKIGDKVVVEKTNARTAVVVKLAPSKYFAPPDPGISLYIRNRLVNRVVLEEDLVDVRIANQMLPFKVVYTRPKGPVIIQKTTNVVVLEKPVEIHKITRVTYEDIGGLKQVIQKIRELVELPLRYPELFKKLGIDPPKGILLYGPPGCGKTLLAKAVATESGANFIAVRGPEVLSKWVGESEKAIRQIFRKARQYAPAVVFFDEIDSIAPSRGYALDTRVTERIVSQLLTEMDGIHRLDNVVVIAATNRPDIIDPALLRPGRFDKLIYVPPPDLNARIEILKIHTRNMPLAGDVDLYEIARKTEGYSGADLEALVREAAMHALRENMYIDRVYMRHFLQAMERIKPSITPDIVKFYIEWYNRARQAIARETARPQVYT